jgi:hypothetical protein
VGGPVRAPYYHVRMHLRLSFPEGDVANFAIARVRLRGTAGPTGEAQNTKVFFRIWSTQTADTGFDPISTYLSHEDGGHCRHPISIP